ncbi:SprT-like domain-containing protein [Membranicola marinus]|uniref:SprT-like domain-containing protein n=1 Tax=Membranihabitans marinus TaxID=1227546 RepID=A0A953HJ09_9BACT|nr:SprT-like domain-containing protein [Membranihabitans marinus]MBY5956602.1 SprT-like domain-containing protein [Membranihabitans marinus]
MKSNHKPTILRQRGIFRGDFEGRTEFIARVRACQAKARELYPDFKLADEELPIVFVWSGRVAGMAKRRKEVYNLEFNIEAIHRDRTEMLENTIPHEMAHIVDMYLHGGKSSHGPRWQSIIRALGGSPQRTHDIPLTKARRSRKYLYEASCGSTVEVGPRHHKSVQRGGTLVVKKTGGKVTRTCFTGRIVLK